MMRKDPTQRGFWRLVVGSFAIHVALLAVWIGITYWQDHSARHRKAIIVQLARKGEKRPEELLPRLQPSAPPVPDVQPKVEPPPPPVEPLPVKKTPPSPVAPPTQAAPPQPKQPTAKDRLAALSKVSGALSRLENKSNEKPEGDPEGIDSGTTSDVQQSLYRSRFGAEVHACLQAHYQFEGVDPTQAQGRGLEAEVTIRVAADGRFQKFDVQVMGGKHPPFERAVRRAIEACGKVSPPPAAIRQEMKRDGLLLLFRP